MVDTFYREWDGEIVSLQQKILGTFPYHDTAWFLALKTSYIHMVTKSTPLSPPVYKAS